MSGIREAIPLPAALDTDLSAARVFSPRLTKACVVAVDAIAISLGMLAAYVVSRQLHPFHSQPATAVCLRVAAVSLPLWVIIFYRYRLYTARYVAARLEELGRLIHAALTSTLVMAAISFLAKQRVSRAWLVQCFPAVVATCLIEREGVRATFNRLRSAGRFLRPVVLVGANPEAQSIWDLLSSRPVLGYRIVGVVDDGSAPPVLDEPILGRVEDTLEVVRWTGANGVIVATTAVTATESNRLVRDLTEAGLHVELSSSLTGIGPERLTVHPLGTTPVMYIEPVQRDGWRAVAKRAFDVICSAITLIVLSPVLAIVAAAVKLDTAGPVLFSQVRVGKDGKPFRVHKFRTMVTNAEDLLADLRSRNEADGPLFKLRDDPRVTRVGRILRRFSIDEFPQLWNVLVGEMSLVGPRPALHSEMAEWSPDLKSRVRVRPGVTGMWQVSGRSDLSYKDYVRLDLYYVDNWSLWRDLAIMLKTIPVVLISHGAY
jgi:exopolysaccharide biosynthesis polyprenyl glycosylphosphotransferase